MRKILDLLVSFCLILMVSGCDTSEAVSSEDSLPLASVTLEQELQTVADFLVPDGFVSLDEFITKNEAVSYTITDKGILFYVNNEFIYDCHFEYDFLLIEYNNQYYLQQNYMSSLLDEDRIRKQAAVEVDSVPTDFVSLSEFVTQYEDLDYMFFEEAISFRYKNKHTYVTVLQNQDFIVACGGVHYINEKYIPMILGE